jgi:S-formylglutathione hydrolase FrmB
VTLAALSLAVARLGVAPRPNGIAARVLSPLAAAVVVITSLSRVNLLYYAYPTVRTAIGLAPTQLNGGRLVQTMDAFAAAHPGLAPVVVIPDPLGSQLGQTLCVDSPKGQAFTYLTVDVPSWITSTLQVDPDRAHRSIGDASAGGTCASQLAVNAPSVPLDVVASGRLPAGATTGAVVIGAEPLDGPDARRVRDALLSAGMDLRFLELPGGHSYEVVAQALRQVLPFVAARVAG